MKNLGVGLDKPIVVYDTSKGDWASRGAYVIHTYGHPHVSILNGGLKKWLSESRPVESGAGPEKNTATDFNFSLISERLKEFEEIHKIATGELPAVQILDARFSKLYDEGHIPNAINIQYSNCIAEDNTIKSAEELKQMFTAAGVDLTQPIIFSCGKGVGATLLKHAAEQVDTSAPKYLYDGSFYEYNKLSNPHHWAKLYIPKQSEHL